jgi:serine O-acetyltransferase
VSVPKAARPSRVWALIRSDYRRYRATGARSGLGVVLLTQGFWASTTYRLAHRANAIAVPIVGQVLHVLFLFIQKGIEIIAGIYLPEDCDVGSGLYIGHFGAMIITGGAKIGDNCNLSQGVTIGFKPQGEWAGYPIIGQRVYIGPNAIIIGGITIGDDAAIGAGAVVTKPVPPRAVVAGNPARIISYAGSFDYVLYDGMETDLARLASLAARAGETDRPAE